MVPAKRVGSVVRNCLATVAVLWVALVGTAQAELPAGFQLAFKVTIEH